MRKKRLWTGGVLISLVVVLVVGGIFSYRSSETMVTATIKDKERVCSGGETTTCEYRVYTDIETFVNKDSVTFGKFASADIQGNLEVGQTYDLRVAGWRIPVMSVFRNIIEIESAHDD